MMFLRREEFDGRRRDQAVQLRIVAEFLIEGVQALRIGD